MKRMHILAIILLIVFTLSVSLSAVVAQDDPESDTTIIVGDDESSSVEIIIVIEPDPIVEVSIVYTLPIRLGPWTYSGAMAAA